MENWPFEVIEVDGKPKIVVEVKGEKQSYFPEEISSMILAEMKATAETYLGKTVRLQTERTYANGHVFLAVTLTLANRPVSFMTACFCFHGPHRCADCIRPSREMVYSRYIIGVCTVIKCVLLVLTCVATTSLIKCFVSLNVRCFFCRSRTP